MTEEGRPVTLMALDIAGFAKNNPDDATQLRLRRRFFEAVQVVFEDLANDSCARAWSDYLFDRGDGALIVLPGVDAASAVLRHALPDLVSRLNSDEGQDTDKIRLRLAIHTGQASRDRWGWAGRDVNLVFRLVDSDKLRKALHKRGETSQVVLALSQAAYEQNKHQVEGPEDADAWRSKGVRKTHKTRKLQVHVKETRTTAWVIGVDVATTGHSGVAPPG